MAQKSKKQLHYALRSAYLDRIVEYLTQAGEEVLQVASNEIAIPCLDSDGNDEYVTIVVKVPTGGKDGEGYDAYGLADEYKRKQVEKAEKAKEQAKKKAEKIARDKAEREAKARAKAEHKAKEGE